MLRVPDNEKGEYPDMNTRLSRIMRAVALTLAGLAFLPACSRATPATAVATSAPPEITGKVYHAMPQTIDPNARYLIFLHSSLVEEEGTDAVHEEYGRYAYDEIIEALLVPDTNVISVIRPGDTKVKRYAGQVVDQVKGLIDAGVSPSHVTVVGFSKGGSIAIYTAAELQNEAVNFVLLGACTGAVSDLPETPIMGRVLSIYDSGDDSSGSCQDVFDQADLGLTAKEISISTGAGHAAFYSPDATWVDPLTAWLAEIE
jgi:predicted esterase